MRRTSTWLVALWIGICSAAGQETTSADDLRKGHQLAIMVCVLSYSSPRPSPYANPEPTGTIVRVNCSTYGYQCRVAGKFHIYNA